MRSTGNAPDYIRHTYKVTNKLKNYTVFELTQVEDGNNSLTEKIRIEKFRGKSNATKIVDYLRLRNTTNWNKCKLITGLRQTNIKGLFYGDWLKLDMSNTHKKTLLIFIISNDLKTLIIDVYRGFYPYHKGILENIISTYKST